MNPDQREEGEVETPLLRAACQKNARIMDILLQYGASTSATNKHLNTPLHEAVGRCNEECVQILLRHECPVNQENLYGMTPLIMATRNGNENIVGHLLRVRTINVSYMTSSRATALTHAAMWVSIRIQ